jgi:twitching motility protein PilT
LIRENQLAQIYSMIQTGSRYGMQTMEDSVNDLLISGTISEETARSALKDSTDDSGDLNTGGEGLNAADAAAAAAMAKKYGGKPPPGKQIPGKAPAGAAKSNPPSIAAGGGAAGGGDDGGYSF